jgi:hypothetical protein
MHPAYLRASEYLFRSICRCSNGLKMTKHGIKNLFSACSGPFLLKNEPNDLVKGLTLSLDIGLYVPPTYKPSSTFLGLFEVPKWPKNGEKQHEKPFFWLIWTISSKKMGLMIWLWAYFQVWTLGHTSSSLGAFGYFSWSIWRCPNSPRMAKNSIKTCFLVVLDHFS